MWREVIELGNTVETVEYGEVIQITDYRKVYADKQSVRQSEFYQGASTGLKPELMFEIRSIEFNNDEKVRFPAGENGREYAIVRTYDKGETTELTVTSHAGSEV